MLSDASFKNGYVFIVPARDAGRFIRETLLSALGQRPAPVEVIVVDDGSTDGTAEIARSIAGVTLVEGCRKGAAAARNIGVACASTPFVSFLDADDLAGPDRMRSHLEVLTADSNCAAVFGGIRFVDREGRFLGKTIGCASGLSEISLGALLKRNRITTCSAVTARRAAVLDVGGFDAALAFNEEYDLWLRLASRYRIACSNVLSVDYRLHEGNVSRNLEGQRRNEQLALLKWEKSAILRTVRTCFRSPEEQWFAYAQVMVRRGDHVDAERALVKVLNLGVMEGSGKAMFMLGGIQLSRGQFGAATASFRAVLSTDDTMAEAWNNLGVALATQSTDQAEIEGCLERALDLRIDYNDASVNLSKLRCGEQPALWTALPLRPVLKPVIGRIQ